MQSLRAVLWNSCPEEKSEYISENISGRVSLWIHIVLSGMVTFFSKHFLKRTVTLKITRKKMRRESSFMVKLHAVQCSLQPYFKRFLHYYGYILLANQCDWIYISSNNWSKAVGRWSESLIDDRINDRLKSVRYFLKRDKEKIVHTFQLDFLLFLHT